MNYLKSLLAEALLKSLQKYADKKKNGADDYIFERAWGDCSKSFKSSIGFLKSIRGK